MRSWDDIVVITRSMMADQEPWVAAMREVNMRYRGDYVIPFPNMAEEPKLPPLTPMLVGEAVDQLGMRASQVEPIMHAPALDPDKATGVRSTEYASIRRRSVFASLKKSKWKLQRPRVTRQAVAYNTACLVVLPDFACKMPLVQVRDPLCSFTEYVDPNTPRPPSFGAFVTRHSGASVRKKYPAARSELGGPISTMHTDYQWDLIEWIDEDQIVFGLLGPQWAKGDHVAESYWNTNPGMLLAGPYPNMSEYPIIIQPRAVTLSGMVSRLSNMLGMIDLQAKMQGLDILAQQKAIFPDTVIIGRANENPVMVSGSWKDGSTGEPNLLSGVEGVTLLRTDVSPATQQTIDRMERNFRTSTGLSPFFGGETFNSLRTGRAIDAMTNMSVDPRIMEIHNLLAEWMPHVNEAILSTWRQMWPGRTYHLVTGLGGDQAVVKLTPATHIETCDTTVEYPFPGADVIQQTQILGSLLGTNSISLKTMRALHPWVPDDEGEGELVRSEQLENAMMQAVQAQIMQGALPLPVLAIIHAKVQQGTPIMTAIQEAEREIQQQQAAAAPPPGAGQLAAPETMPGLAGGPGALMQSAAPGTAPVAPGAPGGPLGGPVPQVRSNRDVEAMNELMMQMRGGR